MVAVNFRAFIWCWEMFFYSLRYVHFLGLSFLLDYEAGAAQWDMVESSHQRYPMCQKFLDVDWVSAERSIGVARYSLLDENGARRMVNAIVYLDKNYPNVDYGGVSHAGEVITEWERSTEEISLLVESDSGLLLSEGQKDSIRNWTFEPFLRRDGAMQFKSGNETFLISRIFWSASESLAGYVKNICLLHPDGARALLLEAPRVGSIYNDAEVKEKYENIKIVLPEGQPSYFVEAFKRSPAIDVNYDGMEDYPGVGVYSFDGRYSVLLPLSLKEDDPGFGRYRFEATGKVCDPYPPDSFFLETDGESYFLNGKCNLTNLTRKGEGE